MSRCPAARQDQATSPRGTQFRRMHRPVAGGDGNSLPAVSQSIRSVPIAPRGATLSSLFLPYRMPLSSHPTTRRAPVARAPFMSITTLMVTPSDPQCRARSRSTERHAIRGGATWVGTLPPVKSGIHLPEAVDSVARATCTGMPTRHAVDQFSRRARPRRQKSWSVTSRTQASDGATSPILCSCTIGRRTRLGKRSRTVSTS